MDRNYFDLTGRVATASSYVTGVQLPVDGGYTCM